MDDVRLIQEVVSHPDRNGNARRGFAVYRVTGFDLWRLTADGLQAQRAYAELDGFHPARGGSALLDVPGLGAFRVVTLPDRKVSRGTFRLLAKGVAA